MNLFLLLVMIRIFIWKFEMQGRVLLIMNKENYGKKLLSRK